MPTSGPIVRTGATPEFWRNWEKAFGGGGKKKPAADKTPAKAAAKKKPVAKKTAAKGKSAKRK